MEKDLAIHQEATAYGIDISLIRDNLRLPPIERLRRHDRALNTMKKLRIAMEKKRG